MALGLRVLALGSRCREIGFCLGFKLSGPSLMVLLWVLVFHWVFAGSHCGFQGFGFRLTARLKGFAGTWGNRVTRSHTEP